MISANVNKQKAESQDGSAWHGNGGLLPIMGQV